MKANELMRFDWVHLSDDNTPRQIDWIRSCEVGLFWNKTVMPPYLEPIPLTPEILEKNGFETHDWADSKLFVHGFENDDLICPFFVEYRIDNQCLFVNEGLVPTPVKYVHQLQHALRLCGLDDLADNFKITKGN